MGRPCVESITRPSTSTDQYTNALCELNLSFNVLQTHLERS